MENELARQNEISAVSTQIPAKRADFSPMTPSARFVGLEF